MLQGLGWFAYRLPMWCREGGKGGGGALGAARWGCVFPPREKEPAFSWDGNTQPQPGSEESGRTALPFAAGMGGGVFERLAWGCVFPPRERTSGPLLRWKHTTPTGQRGVRAHLALLGSDCTPVFSLFYGGTGVGTVHRSHCHIISYHITSDQLIN